jgi:hypothetical protein
VRGSRPGWAGARRRSAGNRAQPGTRVSWQYWPFTAQRLAVSRRGRPGRDKLMRDPVLRQFVPTGWESGRPDADQPRSASSPAIPAGTSCTRRSTMSHAEITGTEPGCSPSKSTATTLTDLPGGPPHGAGRAVPEPAQGTADWPAPPQATPPPGRPAGRIAGRHDDERSAADRGRQPRHTRALGM